MTASEPAATEFRHLHSSSLLFSVLNQIRRYIVPAIILIVVLLTTGDAERRWELWLVVLFVPAVLFELFRYLTLRYRFTEDKLIVRQGLIFRNERHIPLARIQNIDLVQNPLHRAFNVAEVRIETASGQQAEAVFRVLSMDAIERMRERVFAGGGSDTGDDHALVVEGADTAETMRTAPDRRALLELPASELVKFGLISNRGAAIVAGVLYVAWEFDLFDSDSAEEFITTQAKTFEQTPPILLAGLALLAALMLLRVLSVIWVFLRFHGYRIERVGEDLRITGGLITRISATIPRRRIQLVSVHQSILQRLINRVSIRVETAGGIGEGGEERERAIASRRWFVPVVHPDRVPELMRELKSDLDWQHVEWQPLAPKARRRMLARAVLAAVTLGAIVAAIWQPWGALSLALFVPVAVFHAMRAAAYTRYARLPDGLMFRSGVWTRKTTASFFSKMQVISSVQNPFDRRFDHARLRVDTAGAGPAGHQLDVPYLERPVAEELRELLFRQTGRTRFRWS
jgi:putative membrane protein